MCEPQGQLLENDRNPAPSPYVFVQMFDRPALGWLQVGKNAEHLPCRCKVPSQVSGLYRQNIDFMLEFHWAEVQVRLLLLGFFKDFSIEAMLFHLIGEQLPRNSQQQCSAADVTPGFLECLVQSCLF